MNAKGVRALGARLRGRGLSIQVKARRTVSGAWHAFAALVEWESTGANAKAAKAWAPCGLWRRRRR